ncbi:stage III sporulation protein SpoIIIAA [Peribacillus huizhouensis]|uniref:Stage III sporulation protein SpoIIIAA n=2 Tax=Peribacillus huizhouensis TaxID=1501239 RepID=A0ABR6CR81_9BACI|nr:stage III sporulation protein SpoIIIAA [Peribacillus huizhouensis]
MGDLYVLAYFNKEDGSFVEYVRKGRNGAISGYDTFDSARRGFIQSKRSHRAQIYDLRIVKAGEVKIIKEAE